MPAKNAIIDSIYDQGMLPMFYHDDFDISQKTITALRSAGVRITPFEKTAGVIALTNN